LDELTDRKLARHWLTTSDSVLRRLKGPSEEDTLARVVANGDQKAASASLRSGKVSIKKRQSSVYLDACTL
jgi:hypothetical protein